MSRYSKILNQTSPQENRYKSNDQDFETMKHKWLLDPRLDLRKDSKLWVRVLYNAYHLNQEVYGILHGLRCGGAQIELTTDSFRLLQGEWSLSEWEENKKKYLAPIKDKLIAVFKTIRMGQVTQEELPEGLFDPKLNASASNTKGEGQKLIFGVDTTKAKA